jgi:hypothetical protein
VTTVASINAAVAITMASMVSLLSTSFIGS